MSNVTVSSALEELPVGTTTTGSVLAENPHGANATLQIASTMDARCDYIQLVDEDKWGMDEYALPTNTTGPIGYEIDLTGLEDDRIPGSDGRRGRSYREVQREIPRGDNSGDPFGLPLDDILFAGDSRTGVLAFHPTGRVAAAASWSSAR